MNRTIILAGLFVLQAACCAYFVMDLFWHIFWPSRFNWLAESEPIEAVVTFALFLSLFFIASELMKMLRRQSKLDDQIKVASGAFTEVLEERFRDWSLTSAERDVAILAIKGFSIAEMAGLRDTKQGTIKAQCASVYRKADVAGRVQLLSIFLDDLLAEHLVDASGAVKT